MLLICSFFLSSPFVQHSILVAITSPGPASASYPPEHPNPLFQCTLLIPNDFFRAVTLFRYFSISRNGNTRTRFHGARSQSLGDERNIINYRDSGAIPLSGSLPATFNSAEMGPVELQSQIDMHVRANGVDTVSSSSEGLVPMILVIA